MKKVLTTLAVLLTVGMAYASVSFNKINALCAGGRYAEARQELNAMLEGASSDKDRASILGQLSKMSMLIGEEQPAKDQKQKEFADGIKYAEQGIKLNPSDETIWMWHCANVGRDCQTRGMKDQIAAVGVMTEDLSTILNKLGRTEYSEAWQALAEIYFNHPFKSNNAAINFTRKSLMTIPKGEIRIYCYSFFAKMLYQRNWSADRRKEEAVKNAAKFSSGKNSIEKFSFFDGSLGADFKPVWADKGLGAMPDREEAKAIADYAKALYENASTKSKADNNDYKTLSAMQKGWK